MSASAQLSHRPSAEIPTRESSLRDEAIHGRERFLGAERTQTEILREGSAGVAVFHLQERINKYLIANEIPRIKCDGDFGPKTKAAVETIQARLNKELKLDPPLVQDGVWGPKSDEALRTWETQQRGERKPTSSPAATKTFMQDGYYKGQPISFEAREIIDRKDGQRYVLAASVADAFEKMQAAAAKDGIVFNINSAFRSVEEQAALRKDKDGGKISHQVAAPGRSAHNAGYAVDVSTRADPAVERWIKENGRAFGFDRPVKGEPWHWEHIETRQNMARQYGTR